MSPRPTNLDHLKAQYTRDEISLEVFESRAAELIELGIGDCQYSPPMVNNNEAIKRLYCGPIR